MSMPSVHGLAGDPQLRDARTLEPPPSRPARPIVHAAHERAAVALAFGPPAARHFAVKYWDGSVEPALGRSRFTVVLAHPWSLRAMFSPPTEARLAEGYVRGAFDVEGDLEAATALAGPLRDRLGDPRMVVRLLAHVRALPAPPRRHDTPARLPTDARAAPRHSPARDRAAVRSHYDVGNDFYRLWLDERMVYSCAYFATPETTLDDAQRAKLDHVCRKLRLRPGERLLDVGCGWGALAIHAAAHYGVRATGVTLSAPQASLAEQRARDAGLADRVRVEVRDYRELSPDEPYDKIVSVGMFEHVGRNRMAAYFHALHRLLAPGGLFLNHAIIEAPARHGRGWLAALRRILWRPGGFIDRDVFPDGDLVTLALEIEAAEAAGFETRDVESLRPHYAATLRRWGRRLDARYDDAVRLTSEATARTWRLFMAASAHAFATGEIGIDQVLFGKPDSTGTVELPLTRRDLYPNV